MATDAPVTEVESVHETPQWDRPTRYFAAVVVTLLGVAGLFLLGSIIQVLFITFILSYLMHIPCQTIARRTPIPYALAVVLLYIVVVVLLIILVIAVVPEVVQGVNNLWVLVAQGYDQFISWLKYYQQGDVIVQILGFELDLHPYIDPLQRFFVPRPAPELPQLGLENLRVPDQPASDLLQNINIRSILQELLNLAGGVTLFVASTIGTLAGFVVTLGLALFLSFLTLLDLRRARGFIFNWVGAPYRREAQLLLANIDRVWLGFFRGQVVIGGLLGVLAYVQFIIMGIPGALPLAIMNAFVSLIPNIGGLLSAIPIILVALFAGSTSPLFDTLSNGTFALLVGIVMTIYSQLVYNVVSPVVVGKSVNLPVVVVIVGVIIGFALAGVLGAFLVVPVISTLRITVGYLLAKIAQREPFPGEEIVELPKLGLFSQFYDYNLASEIHGSQVLIDAPATKSS